MASGSKPIFLICAESYKHYLRWCSDNRRDQHDPQHVVIVNEDNFKRLSHGRHRIEGDETIVLGNPDPFVLKTFREILASAGFYDV